MHRKIGGVSPCVGVTDGPEISGGSESSVVHTKGKAALVEWSIDKTVERGVV